MKTYLIKIVTILLCVMVVLSNFSIIEAYDITGEFTGEINSDVDTQGVQKIITTILDIVRFIGAGIALIILMYIGVKFIIASPGEKANIKEYLMNYIIGAVILMGASGILTIIKQFVQNNIVVQ